MDKKRYLIKDNEGIVEYTTQDGIIVDICRKGGTQSPQTDVETIIRQSISAIILHPTHNTILLAYGKKWPGIMFPGGGIDENESPEAAIRREIKEETGYTDIASINFFSQSIKKHYYHIPKNVNIQSVDQLCIVLLSSLTQVSILVEETIKHDMKRIDKNEVYSSITAPSHQLFRYRYLNKDRPLSQIDQEFIQLQQEKNSQFIT